MMPPPPPLHHLCKILLTRKINSVDGEFSSVQWRVLFRSTVRVDHPSSLDDEQKISSSNCSLCDDDETGMRSKLIERTTRQEESLVNSLFLQHESAAFEWRVSNETRGGYFTFFFYLILENWIQRKEGWNYGKGCVEKSSYEFSKEWKRAPLFLSEKPSSLSFTEENFFFHDIPSLDARWWATRITWE
jgi:hypothetical protein